MVASESVFAPVPVSTGGNFRHSEAPEHSGRPEIGLPQGLGCSRISRSFKLWSSGASRLRLAEIAAQPDCEVLCSGPGRATG